jgi:parallel beta-helix repeat protein
MLRNKILNTRFGVGFSTDTLLPPGNSLKTLFMDNEIRNYSGDGLRPIGSDILVFRNQIIDSYVTPAAGDPNHDDAIQLWALNGATYDNIIIDDNYVIDVTDQMRALKGEAQGISIFDGTDTNLIIRNNIVLVSAYHGIMIMGGKDCRIEGNTVASSQPNGRDTWIGVWKNKDGSSPVNVVVQNNIAATYNFGDVTTGLVQSNNYTVSTVDAPANYKLYDLANAQYDLTPLVGSSIYGKGAGAIPSP